MGVAHRCFMPPARPPCALCGPSKSVSVGNGCENGWPAPASTVLTCAAPEIRLSGRALSGFSHCPTDGVALALMNGRASVQPTEQQQQPELVAIPAAKRVARSGVRITPVRSCSRKDPRRNSEGLGPSITDRPRCGGGPAARPVPRLPSRGPADD